MWAGQDGSMNIAITNYVFSWLLWCLFRGRALLLLADACILFMTPLSCVQHPSQDKFSALSPWYLPAAGVTVEGERHELNFAHLALRNGAGTKRVWSISPWLTLSSLALRVIDPGIEPSIPPTLFLYESVTSSSLSTLYRLGRHRIALISRHWQDWTDTAEHCICIYEISERHP